MGKSKAWLSLEERRPVTTDLFQALQTEPAYLTILKVDLTAPFAIPRELDFHKVILAPNITHIKDHTYPRTKYHILRISVRVSWNFQMLLYGPGFVRNFSYNPKCCKNLEAFETFLLLMKSFYWLKMIEESNQIPLFLKSDILILCIEMC